MPFHTKGILILIIAVTCVLAESVAGNQPFNARRVAHGGGGIEGKKVTNSLEALDQNIKNGFLYFEIDFSFTKDRQLVCIHGWKRNFERTFGFETRERPTLETFNYLVRNASKLKNCTLDDLALWMKNNPGATLITDVKDDNIEALRIIARKIPNAHNRVIPQIYIPSNYSIVKDMGYESIIWTLYRYRGSNDKVVRSTENFDGPFAVTMPRNRAMTQLPALLKKKGIPTYAHTINDVKTLDRLKAIYNVTEIYTDFLRPSSTE